ncbi:MAG: sensor histidine kinase, partial [Phycisphaeraceae bacterium]
MDEQRSPSQSFSAKADLLDQTLGEIERLQQEIDALREQLSHENRLSELGQLAACLAHEINNLLTPIGSYAQLAMSDPGNARLTSRALTIAKEGAAKASRLADATLGLVIDARPRSSATCSAGASVRKTLEYLTPMLQHDGIDASADVPDVRVAIDELALQQVLINLVNNARNAMDEWGGRKSIRVVAEAAGGALTLRVSDTGPGIAAERRGGLFEPFNREPRAGGASEATSGSGLGLSICKGLVESVGGTLKLEESNERAGDSGAVFRIVLP